MEPSEEEKRAYAARVAAREAAREAPVAVAEAAPLPAVHYSDQGGELSMSVGDSNKLRAALGLAPLEASKAKGDEALAEHRRHRDAQAAKAARISEDSAREKVVAAKERRRLDAQLKKTTHLGADDAHDDDVRVSLRGGGRTRGCPGLQPSRVALLRAGR